MEKIFHQSSRCYGTSIDSTRLIFIRDTTNSVNLSSTNLVNIINGNHELNVPNIPNLNSQNPFSQESFLFILVGIPTDGILWKEIVLSISTQYLNHYFYVFRKQVMVQMMLEIHVKKHFPTTNISRKEWIHIRQVAEVYIFGIMFHVKQYLKIIPILRVIPETICC